MITIQGIVQKGKKRGKGLGFPTANIKLSKDVSDGVYISQTVVDRKTYNSITFIGAAKTFGEKDKKAETYILSYNKDIYGVEIKVKLINKIRDNMQFSSASELTKQMEKDKIEVLNYFNSS